MNVSGIQPEDVANWKDRLSWHFGSFCRDGTITSDELWDDIESKQRQLWVVDDGEEIKAAVLTSISSDRLKTFEVTHAAGRDRETWQHFLGALGGWARGIGCKRIRVTARPGWERILPLKKTHVILEGRL